MSEDKNTVWPVPQFRFKVMWGTTKILFSEVSGLDMENGESKIVSLKRGEFIGDSASYEDWYASISLKNEKLVDVSIHLLNEDDESMMSWILINAYATKVISADFKSADNRPLIEELEVAFETLQVSS